VRNYNQRDEELLVYSGTAFGAPPPLRQATADAEKPVRILVDAVAGDGSAANVEMEMEDGAEDGTDALDVTVPPPAPGSGVTLALSDGTGRSLLREARRTSSEGGIWHASLGAPGGEPIRIRVSHHLPSGWKLRIIAAGIGGARDMAPVDSLELPSWGLASHEELTIVAGTPEFIASGKGGGSEPRSHSISCRVYPSPVPRGGALSIAVTNPHAGFVSAKIVDLQGRAILTLVDGPMGSGEVTFTLKPASLAAPLRGGMYWLLLRTTDGAVVQRFVVFD
jgi:hypothetical protein